MKWMRTLFTAVLALGLAAPAMAQVTANSETPGSVLVFHRFVRGTVTGNLPRSSFEISVVCPAGLAGTAACAEFATAVKLKAVWVCPSSQQPRAKRICKGTDFEMRTTVKGTLWFNPENNANALSPSTNPSPVSPILTPFVPTPPCNQGYLIVWVINNDDRPVNFNGLIGNAVLRDQANSASAYNALPIQAVAGLPGSLTAPIGNPGDALAFDGVQYARVTGNIAGTVRYNTTGITTYLTLLTLDVRVNTPNLVTFVAIDAYNENERPISSFIEFICWTRKSLEAINDNYDSNFGGLFAKKGLIESVRTATQQNTDPPFQTFDATLVGIVETQEAGSAYAYALFHDGVGVSTRFCHTVGAPCPF